MSPLNSSLNPKGMSNPDKKANPVVGWLILIAIGVGIWWVYDRNQKGKPKDADHARSELGCHSGRGEDVPEDRSGKGKIIIQP